MATISIPVIKVSQHIGDYYAGVISAQDLLYISKSDRLRLTDLIIPKYAGYQRALIPERVNDIRDYLRTPRSTFPNAIILNIDSDYIENWKDIKANNIVSVLEIKKEKQVAQIIDGQHRVAALDAVSKDYSIIVSIFIDLELTRCAEIFAKINSTQKSVNPSIAFQLFGYSEDRSPQKTAHNIAETLNRTKGSPFFKRLRMLGTKDEWTIGSLSQSTFSKYLMILYTRDPGGDENRLLRKEKLEIYDKYPLREFFMQNEDKTILTIVWNYFFNIANNWPEQWNDQSGQSILVKTTGYIALIEVLKHWLLNEKSSQIINNDGVIEAFKRIKAKYEDKGSRFVRGNYPSGNQGVITLRNTLIKDLKI
jgi:DGQHR domain-containing protein